MTHLVFRSCRLGGLAALCVLAGSAVPAAISQAAPLTVLVSDERGQPLADAVVSVQVRGAPARAAAGTRAELAQRGKRFAPAVLAIQTGTAVDFPNFDTVRHHVYSFSPVKTFELKLYAGTPTAPVLFDKPGTAILGCNIHDQMAAHVRVVDTPYFATTDATGHARLELPPGEHLISTWHAGLAADQPAPTRPVRIGTAPANVTVLLKAL